MVVRSLLEGLTNLFRREEEEYCLRDGGGWDVGEADC